MTTKEFLAVVTLVVGVSNEGEAADGRPRYTLGEMVENCRRAEEMFSGAKLGGAHLYETGRCAGYVTGLASVLADNCVMLTMDKGIAGRGVYQMADTSGAITQELIRVFIAWAERHPSRWRDGSGAGADALVQAFPCQG